MIIHRTYDTYPMDSACVVFAADPIVKEMHSLGGYVAGGAARVCFLGWDIAQYLSKHDVDVFFRDEASCDIARERFGRTLIDISILGTRTKVQLTKCRIGSPEDVLSRFPLTNSRVALDAHGIWIDDMFEHYEMLKQAHVGSIDNGVFGLHAARLIERHGYMPAPESRDCLKQWACAHDMGMWSRMAGILKRSLDLMS